MQEPKKTLKAIIQIPCFNEAEALPVTLKELPRKLKGVDVVEWLIVDDGSTDDTVAVARKLGVDHVVSNPVNMGLAKTFMNGIEASLKNGADIIIHTDADNQYCAADIPKLIAPILAGEAEMVVGARPITDIDHFAASKKQLQKLGSWMVRKLSGTEVQDAPSGFRAFTKEAALQLHVFNAYTYTLETIIQAGHKGMRVASVPIRVNADLRESRLVKSIPDYIRRPILTMFRMFMVYSPLKFFFALGSLLFAAGFLLGVQSWFFALVADLLATNRTILEEIRTRLRVQALKDK